ncbi:unnamed protein product [Sphagnum balticum]
MEKEEVPVRDDIVYMLESAMESEETGNDSTVVFCIDASGSMNTTTEVVGKVDLKFGLSEEEIEMLKAFMEPGDEAQFNFLPGAHNKNKTFVSRRQCILSAIEHQLSELRKVDPSRRTALGPGLLAAIEVAGRGSKGSTVVVCTDGLANRGLGVLEGTGEEGRKFYEWLGDQAKTRNVSVSVVTIKGEGAKL